MEKWKQLGINYFSYHCYLFISPRRMRESPMNRISCNGSVCGVLLPSFLAVFQPSLRNSRCSFYFGHLWPNFSPAPGSSWKVYLSICHARNMNMLASPSSRCQLKMLRNLVCVVWLFWGELLHFYHCVRHHKAALSCMLRFIRSRWRVSSVASHSTKSAGHRKIV